MADERRSFDVDVDLDTEPGICHLRARSGLELARELAVPNAVIKAAALELFRREVMAELQAAAPGRAGPVLVTSI